MKFFILIAFNMLAAFSIFAQKQAEVIVTSTYLRKSPDKKSEHLQIVKKGEKVVFEKNQKKSGWYFVSTSGGTVKGWILGDTLRLVKIDENAARKSPAAFPAQVPKTKPAPDANEPPAVNQSADSKTIASASAESAPAIEDNEVIRVDTAEVVLSVRVINSDKRLVKNLNQSDFKIYEDGVLQPISSLRIAEAPIINALLIDNSRSLRSQLGKIIEAGKIIVAANKLKDESAVVRFVGSDEIEVVQNFTSKKDALDYALDNLFVEGGQTAIIDALYKTVKDVEQYQNSGEKDDPKLRAVILVSDGDDRGSVYNEKQLFELLRNSNVQIYAIGFISDLSKEKDSSGVSRQEKSKAFLTRLARETGGKFYFPDSIDDLPRIASDISGELRTQYLISYTPTNVAADGAFRNIKVEVSDGENKEKRIAVSRTGRNAPSP